MENREVKNVLNKIKLLAKEIGRPVSLMEVCGTHTQTVARYGIKQLLPKSIKLITGPGCPACVTPQEDIDAVVNLALAGVPVASYGDVLKLPGFYGTLNKAREKGAWVREVYSVEEALEFQKERPDLVFFGIGFETTAPMTAFAVKNGLTCYSSHRLFLTAFSALLEIKEIKIDGFIAPGHVSTITGSNAYEKLNVPLVITGFEPEDVLASVHLLLKQIQEGRAEVENEYQRSVMPEGNPLAYKMIFDVFDVKEGNWRGLGKIPKSGLELKKKFSELDAKIKYKNILAKVDFSKSRIKTGCACADIILGKKEPKNCPLFKRVCAPENPKGPCMVSQEGACYAEFSCQ